MKLSNIFLLLPLLLCFTACETVPTEDLFFSSIPNRISKEDAIEIVHTAALRREWKVTVTETDTLKTELHHRRYKASLLFTFQDHEIRYSDYSRYLSNTHQGSGENGVNKSAPKNWIIYLQRDVNKIFCNMLLEDLKNQHEKDMMSEGEYQRKKEELRAEYL